MIIIPWNILACGDNALILIYAMLILFRPDVLNFVYCFQIQSSISKI